MKGVTLNSDYGSEWRKWDLHVHTPFSVLNNQFHLSSGTPEDFDKYVTELFTSAVKKGICAIGVTDYFSVEGYTKIRNEYLSHPDVMARLFPDEGLRSKVCKIAVFPNVELRLSNIFAIHKGEEIKDEFVDYHVIFSDQIDPAEIDRNFLGALHFQTTDPNQKLPLNKANIEAFGKEIAEQNGSHYGAYRTGLERLAVDSKDILDALSSCTAFSGKYLIALPVDEALPHIKWDGRGYPLRRVITRQAHIFFSSSEKTREWAAGGREWDEKEFGAPRPCIVASDAHDFEHLFEPSCGKYCWIKADPTFEGLLQVLCEPVDRVAIQRDRPGNLDPHKSIESLRFDDRRFQREPIVFSDSLTCIIGGRSTGKSMLLRNLAWGIDPEYARGQEARCETGKFSPAENVEVVWRDHVPSERRKIIYLPQTYLNRTVDNPESGDGSSGLIGDVLLQDDAILRSHQLLESECSRIRAQTASDIGDYFRTKQDCEGLSRTIIEKGGTELFEAEIIKLEERSNELAESVSATKDEIELYGSLNEQKIQIEARISELEEDASAVGSASLPTLHEPQLRGGNLSRSLSPSAAEALQNVMDSLNEIISNRWEEERRRFTEDLSAKKEVMSKRLKEIEEKLLALKPKVEQSNQLSKVMSRLSEEKKLLAEARERENGLQKLQSELSRLRALILASRSQYFEAYTAYCNTISKLTGSFSSDLTFSAEPICRLSDFSSSVLGSLNSRRFSQFERKRGHNLSDLGPQDYSDNLLSDVWADIENSSGDGPILQLKSGVSEEEFVRALFNDWYNVHYIVISDGDQLAEMSPGKKGLVLLELIIELEKGNCPILIDQPEDDLDNRSIFEELRRFIKDSKKRRQIIVVTHNANIVLGADAEEIVVANQDGAGTSNICRQFEYRSGSIENNEEAQENDGPSWPYLYKYSIQDLICRTLEGGREALEQRRKKYGLLN